MKTQIDKILNLTTFFKKNQCSTNYITCSLEAPSLIVLRNIHKIWMQSIYTKTKQHYPVYLSKEVPEKKRKNQNHGYIDQCLPSQVQDICVNYSNQICSVKENSVLKFNALMPQHDAIQGFIQWQRYRKYWWSSITTTPGLFSVTDMKYEEENAHANISANFNWGQWIVESVKVTPPENATSKSSQLCCTMSLEKALITLLLDATTSAREEYLRLHNTMAPYKISFALNCEDKYNFLILQELAKQIFYKLQSNKISTWLPEFSLSLEPQIEENMQLGVSYIAILSEDTLSNGIFHLMNSSTMLKEQVHLADFVNYATLLCGKRI